MRDLTQADRILKVDHAGEHGAVNIYRGQVMVCRLFQPTYVEELADFQAHEERHRQVFGDALRARSVRRCRSYWLCGAGGFLLGFVTALCGKSAIAATTLAVERVVLRHLEEQLAYLKEADLPAYAAVFSIVEDEQTHHDRSALIATQGRFWPKLLMPVVSVSTEAVIWLGMRL